MSRINLENNKIREARLHSPTYSSVTMDIDSVYVIQPDAPTYQFLNPGGIPAAVFVPSVQPGGGQLFLITNEGGANIAVHENLSGLFIATIAAGQTALIFSSHTEWKGWVQSSSGVEGDVVGPGGAFPNSIARFFGTSGKAIQDSQVLISGGGEVFLGGGAASEGPLPRLNFGDYFDTAPPFGASHIALWSIAGDGVSSAIGFGVSPNQLNYVVPNPGSSHNFYTSDLTDFAVRIADKDQVAAPSSGTLRIRGGTAIEGMLWVRDWAFIGVTAPHAGARLTLGGSIQGNVTDPRMVSDFSTFETGAMYYGANVLIANWLGTGYGAALAGQSVIGPSSAPDPTFGASAGGVFGGVRVEKAGGDPWGTLGCIFQVATLDPTAGAGVWGLIRGIVQGIDFTHALRASSETVSGNPDAGVYVLNHLATNAFRNGILVGSAVDYGVRVGLAPGNPFFGAANTILPLHPYSFFDLDGTEQFYVSNTGTVVARAMAVREAIGILGSVSGQITIRNETGNYDFILPTSAGTVGQVLTSAGPGEPMVWA